MHNSLLFVSKFTFFLFVLFVFSSVWGFPSIPSARLPKPNFRPNFTGLLHWGVWDPAQREVERGSRISLNSTFTQVGLMSGEQRNSQHSNRISHQTQRRVVESAPRACKYPWRVLMSVLATWSTYALRS
jgi:hypothetical protein